MLSHVIAKIVIFISVRKVLRNVITGDHGILFSERKVLLMFVARQGLGESLI